MDDDELDYRYEIENMVTHQMTQVRNSVLASQIQKALPNISSTEKFSSLHTVLQQMSDTSLWRESEANDKQIVLKLPRKSLKCEDVLHEYIMPGDENNLLRDKFVRKLPVSIEEKRYYRKSIVIHMKRKPWYIKLHDYLMNKYADFQCWIDFWNETLKIIEGQHGASIVAYFLFLRWLLYVNIIIFLLNFIFIITPYVVFTHAKSPKDVNHAVYVDKVAFNMASSEVRSKNLTEVYFHGKILKQYHFKIIPTDHVDHSSENITNSSSLDIITQHCSGLYRQQILNDTSAGFLAAIQNFLQGTGPLEPTVLFAGAFPPFLVTFLGHVYNVPFAFVCVLLATFIICIIMMIQYSSIGIQEAFIAQNQRSNYYTNEVFSGWDYGIDTPITADLHHYKLVFEIKTNLNEERAMRQFTCMSSEAWTKLYVVRLLINTFIVLWLFASLYIIYFTAVYQMKEMQKHQLFEVGFRTFFIHFLTSFTIVILNGISPTVFDLLVPFEKYSFQTSVNLSLFRNLFLYLSSIIVLLNTIQSHVACKPKDICGAGLDKTCRSPRCWETYVGQQLFKLTLVDLFVYFAVFFGYDLVQYYITWNYDNMLTRFWGHPIFFLPTEVLAPINSQTILWLGFFYSPLLPAVTICKLIVIFYIKKIKILLLCDPTEKSYRASRFNSVFVFILFISFFFVLMVHILALERLPPSRGCGPFRYFEKIGEAIPETTRNSLSFLMSYWFISFATILLCCAIHYYWSVATSQKELTKSLKAHLVLQSFDKQYLLQAISDLSRDKRKMSLHKSRKTRRQ